MLFIFFATDDEMLQARIYIWWHCMEQLNGIVEGKSVGLFMSQFASFDKAEI